MTYSFLERLTTSIANRSSASSCSLSALEYSHLSKRLVRRAIIVIAFAVALILAMFLTVS